jgi:hypothetical protein
MLFGHEIHVPFAKVPGSNTEHVIYRLVSGLKLQKDRQATRP